MKMKFFPTLFTMKRAKTRKDGPSDVREQNVKTTFEKKNLLCLPHFEYVQFEPA